MVLTTPSAGLIRPMLSSDRRNIVRSVCSANALLSASNSSVYRYGVVSSPGVIDTTSVVAPNESATTEKKALSSSGGTGSVLLLQAENERSNTADIRVCTAIYTPTLILHAMFFTIQSYSFFAICAKKNASNAKFFQNRVRRACYFTGSKKPLTS